MPFVHTSKRTEPMKIPVKRTYGQDLASSVCPRPYETPDLLFEMDPLSYDQYNHCSQSIPHSSLNYSEDSLLYSFPIVPKPPLSALNNGQSKATTPFLSPSSTCSSSESYDVGCKVDPWPKVPLQRGHQSPSSKVNNAPVVRSTAATKITGFTPYLPGPTPTNEQDKPKMSTIRTFPHAFHSSHIIRSNDTPLENLVDLLDELPERNARFQCLERAPLEL